MKDGKLPAKPKKGKLTKRRLRIIEVGAYVLMAIAAVLAALATVL